MSDLMPRFDGLGQQIQRRHEHQDATVGHQQLRDRRRDDCLPRPARGVHLPAQTAGSDATRRGVEAADDVGDGFESGGPGVLQPSCSLRAQDRQGAAAGRQSQTGQTATPASTVSFSQSQLRTMGAWSYPDQTDALPTGLLDGLITESGLTRLRPCRYRDATASVAQAAWFLAQGGLGGSQSPLWGGH